MCPSNAAAASVLPRAGSSAGPCLRRRKVSRSGSAPQTAWARATTTTRAPTGRSARPMAGSRRPAGSSTVVPRRARVESAPRRQPKAAPADCASCCPISTMIGIVNPRAVRVWRASPVWPAMLAVCTSTGSPAAVPAESISGYDHAVARVVGEVADDAGVMASGTCYCVSCRDRLHQGALASGSLFSVAVASTKSSRMSARSISRHPDAGTGVEGRIPDRLPRGEFVVGVRPDTCTPRWPAPGPWRDTRRVGPSARHR